eukprot:SM000293S10925  [mRNA]  locus=s293:135732:136096:- [translate_table: standard]
MTHIIGPPAEVMEAYPLLVRKLDLMGLRVCPSKSVAWSTRAPPRLSDPMPMGWPSSRSPSVHQLTELYFFCSRTCGNAFKNTSPTSLLFPCLGTHSWRWPSSPAASADGLAIFN